MGIVTKLKSGLDQAQQAAATVGTPMADAEREGYAELAGKLARSGVSCAVTILSLEATGKRDSDTTQFAIEVEVETGRDGDAYRTIVEQYLGDEVVADHVPGTRWEAKADPDDPCRLLLYGRAS